MEVNGSLAGTSKPLRVKLLFRNIQVIYNQLLLYIQMFFLCRELTGLELNWSEHECYYFIWFNIIVIMACLNEYIYIGNYEQQPTIRNTGL